MHGLSECPFVSVCVCVSLCLCMSVCVCVCVCVSLHMALYVPLVPCWSPRSPHPLAFGAVMKKDLRDTPEMRVSHSSQEQTFM